MPELVIIQGTQDFHLPASAEPTFVYFLGAGSSHGTDVVEVNDPRRLHQIALETRDDYSGWIYSLNQIFLENGLIYKDLSLFLISDCSCKRTELFDTFSSICNLLLLKEIISEKAPTRIRLVGVNRKFINGLKSFATDIPIVTSSEHRWSGRGFRRLASDLQFIFEIAAIVFLKHFFDDRRDREKVKRRYFFTIFPKMASNNGRDNKYGSFVHKDDRYAASIVTDGLHQHVSVRRFFRLRNEAKKYGFTVIDDCLRHQDWARGLFWLVRMRWKLFVGPIQQSFLGINVSGWVKEEFSQSVSRLTRFMIIKGALERFFNDCPIKEFIYYLHEYPFGRLISWLLSTQQPEVLRTGFQHGPAAWRKLVYFMSPKENAEHPDYRMNVPIPSRILAEDDVSADIYRYSGYRNVTVMDNIPRLGYLEGIERRPDPALSLIAPGLHDGKAMLKVLSGIILENPSKTFLYKPHPLANNQYVDQFKERLGFDVTTKSLQELLAEVSEVFVTYSSLGPEAFGLGIRVRVVEIPGVINESPLEDLKNIDDWVVVSKQVSGHYSL